MTAECALGLPFQYVDGAVVCDVDLSVYRLSAIQKTSYRLADKCTVVLGSIISGRLRVTLLFPTAMQEPSAISVARLFFQELLDQELREQLGAETKAIRALILAQAFSRTDLIGDG